jgi:hypothetical protein
MCNGDVKNYDPIVSEPREGKVIHRVLYCVLEQESEVNSYLKDLETCLNDESLISEHGEFHFLDESCKEVLCNEKVEEDES